MNKSIIITIIAITCSISILGQTTTEGCVFKHPTSTNPLDPQNDEYLDFFQNSSTHVTINSFLNSKFNWYNNFDRAILIGVSPRWHSNIANFHQGPSNSYYPMIWPWHSSMVGADYLHEFIEYKNENPNTPEYKTLEEDARDFRWEDGWELLWMNLGYLPNGNDLDDLPNGSLWPSTSSIASPNPNHIPYFVLYNRYNGVLRLFANVWDVDGNRVTIDNVLVSLGFLPGDGPGGYKNVSGIFRIVEGLDKPLDQETDITNVLSPRLNASKASEWLVAEFQLSYDPCICGNEREIQFLFEGYQELELSGTIRGIEVPQNINNFSSEGTFLNLQDVDDNYESGTHIYPLIDALFLDYQNKLDEYNQNLKDYNSFDNQLKKQLVDLVKVGVGEGIPSIIPTGALSDFISNTQLKLWGDKHPVDKKEAEKWATSLKNSTKKILADELDFLSVALNISEKPSRPQVPVANYSESGFKAFIQDYVPPVRTAPLIVPGSNPLVSSITPATFSAYNNLPGTFAVIKKPKLNMYQEDYTISEFGEATYFLDSDEYMESWDGMVYSKTRYGFIVPDGVEYAINKALDWDFDKTKFLVSFQFEFKQNDYSLDVDKLTTEVNNGNFGLLHRFFLPHNQSLGQLTYVVNSDYYEISELSNTIFDFEMTNNQELFLTTENFGGLFNTIQLNGHISYVATHLQPELVSIKMKIASDMYFDQLAYVPEAEQSSSVVGEQVNTFQVRTFEIYNKDLEPTIDDQLGYTLMENSTALDAYAIGEFLVWDQPGQPYNNYDSYFQVPKFNSFTTIGERVSVIGEISPLSVNEGVIKATQYVKLLPGTHIYATTKIKIDKEALGNDPSLKATESEILDFCESENYQAGYASNKALDRLEKEKQRRQLLQARSPLALSVYPNPATSYVQIDIQNQEQSVKEVQLDLLDVTGLTVLQKKLKANASGRYILRLPALSTGMYFIKITSNEKTAIEKIMIQQ